MKKLLLSIILILFFAIVVISFAISKYEISDDVARENDCFGQHHYSISKYIKTTSGSLYVDTSYLINNSICRIQDIKNDIAILSALVKNKSIEDSIMYQILTEKLYKIDSSKLETFNLLALAEKLQWSEKFNSYSEIDINNADLFSSIYEFWLEKISDILRDYSIKEPEIIYTKQFNYLVSRCNEKRHSVPVRISNTQKFIHNLLNDKWSHLINATWNQSSIFQKVVFFIIILLTGFSYYYSLSKILFSNVKK